MNWSSTNVPFRYPQPDGRQSYKKWELYHDDFSATVSAGSGPAGNACSVWVIRNKYDIEVARGSQKLAKDARAVVEGCLQVLIDLT